MAVFIATIVITGNIVNLDSNDMTTMMSQPSYPTVTTEYYGQEINLMYGYRNTMELSYMRDSITPLMTGRKMRLKIDTHGNNIAAVRYEVRTIDGKRLIENNEISEYVPVAGKISLEITLKDLIDNNTEYEFILITKLSNGDDIRFYTRVINPDEYYVSDKLEYVRDFSDKTFNKITAEELKKYLEPKSYAVNNDLGYVDIHSNFDQVTWGDINPVRMSDPVIMIKELAPMTGSFVLNYYVSTNEEQNLKYYAVKEFYRVRYTKERMYLLDYERTMDEVFVDNKNSYGENSILLGVNSHPTDMLESDDGTNIAFVTGKRIYEYNVTDNKVAYLFGFYDQYTEDIRMTNDNFDIKIMNVDEAGNVTFLVYGYMNRGSHEGESGMCAYFYDAKVNTIEELLYIPSDFAPDLLMRRVEELSYMNSRGVLYLLAGGSLYGIDSIRHEVSVIADDLKDGGFVISPNNHLVAWQQGENIYDSKSIVLMNLETGVKRTIEFGDNRIVKPISFIGEDLIYGIANENEIIKDKAGNKVLLMNQINIENETDGVLMEYKQEGKYIIDGEVKQNQIILHRMELTEEGYTDTTDDQIVNSQDSTVTKNVLNTYENGIYQTVSQITLQKPLNASSMKHLTPKMVLFEGNRSVKLEENDSVSEYVVYGKYGADSIYENAGLAVCRAYDISGIVMNETGDYIWKKTTRNYKNQIMAIEQSSLKDDVSSIAVCMDVMLEYEGVVRNSQYMLSQNQSVIDILKDALTDYEVLDLTGCSLDMVLYYVNMDIPVLLMLDDENAVLVIGFNEKEIVIMNPLKDDIYKVTMEEAVDWFEENGNCFITYMPKAK